MIVLDASALATLARAGVLGLVLAEFDVHTTAVVLDEIEAQSAFHGARGDGARAALDHRDGLTVHPGDQDAFESSRVDRGQGSCATLAVQRGADAMLTDDFRALPELERLVPGPIADSSIVLAVLVRRGVLAQGDARFRLEALTEESDWLGRPVYRRAMASLDTAPI